VNFGDYSSDALQTFGSFQMPEHGDANGKSQAAPETPNRSVTPRQKTSSQPPVSADEGLFWTKHLKQKNRTTQ